MRPQGRIKMGYYPTPVSVARHIKSYLSFPCENVNILDPCCGEGTALGTLVEDTSTTTYGIELDEYRFKQSKKTLDHVLHCGYEDARISNNTFSCLYLNPPYDWQTNDTDTGSERTEKAFLKGTIRYLQPEGILVYIVPQKRITGDVAKILAYRFEELNACRFPDDEYEQFKQIVLFGKKKRRSRLDETSHGMLTMIPHRDLPEITYQHEPAYDLPVAPEVKVFRSKLIDEAELEEQLASSVLWEKLDGNGRLNGNAVERPPLPLHTGHLGLLLASGCLDGMVGQGDDRHIVRGKVEKISHTIEEYEGDVLIERQVEKYRVSVKVLTPDGEIRNLM